MSEPETLELPWARPRKGSGGLASSEEVLTFPTMEDPADTDRMSVRKTYEGTPVSKGGWGYSTVDQSARRGRSKDREIPRYWVQGLAVGT